MMLIPSKIYIKANGPKETKGSDIETGAHVKFLNKDLHICTLDSKAPTIRLFR